MAPPCARQHFYAPELLVLQFGMEAIMSLRLISCLALGVSFIAVAADCSRALAQIEFAKATIRFTAAPEPAMAQPVAVPAPSVPVEVRAPAAPIVHHPVRQAAYEEPVMSHPQFQPQMPSRAPSRVSAHAGSAAQMTLSKLPGPAPVQAKPAGLPAQPRGKPFQSVQHDPAVSPYLNLYRTERGGNGLPNYLTLVRPQLDQIQANRQQAAEMQRLRSQVQSLSSGVPGGAPSARMGSSARYMDTAQFYGGMKR
jgi:hypothetical protein